ncbi:MAG: hypothetical protein ACI8Z9_000880, partial [Paraglaciecola sp.]
RIKSFEHKIMLNGQNQQLAFSAAEAGLMRSLGVLSEDKNWDGAAIVETLDGESTFTATGSRAEIARASTTMTLISLSSTGMSADGLASVTVNEQALNYSILANPPDVPLIVAGGLAVGGNFEVVANPNGGGIGVPLSIWTDAAVDMSGSGTTCGQQEFSDGACSSSPYSENGYKNSDIVDSDPDFPDDLMEYLFNIPSSEWLTLRSEADQTLGDCTSLDLLSLGLIWIDGGCSLNAGTIVGSTADPVILVVTDGDITMNGGAIINGIVFSFRKPGTTTDFDLSMIGGARVNGVLASNHPVGLSSGTYNAVYDADVLAQIKAHDAFQRTARVPGSWRDF